MKTSKNFLFHNLPCVSYKNSYLIFSPHAKAVAKIPIKKLNKNRDKIKTYLKKTNFFSKHLWQKSIKNILITLFITTDCNFRCKYCYLNAGKKPRYMDEEIALGIIKRILKQKPKKVSIHFFGGEPTLNMPVLKKVINFIKTKKTKHDFHITTNGAVSDQDLSYLIKNKFGFTVSMDSIPRINDKERIFENGSATSQVVEKTIKKLITKKAKVSIRATITKSNLKYLPEAVKYWSNLGIKFVHFELMNPVGRGIQLPKVNIKEYVQYVKRALDVAEKKKIFIINSAYMNLLTPSNYFCMSCKGERLIFFPDGTISLCYEVQKPISIYKNFIVGKFDIKKQDFIINKDRLKMMGKINVDFFKKCKNCFAKYICAGGCPKRNLEATGSFFKTNPIDCKIKKELIRDAILRIYQANENNRLSSVFGTTLIENF